MGRDLTPGTEYTVLRFREARLGVNICYEDIFPEISRGLVARGANVLVAIFSEQESQAVYFLDQQGVTRLDIVNFISHGISKIPMEGERPDEGEGGVEAPPDEARTASPLERA